MNREFCIILKLSIHYPHTIFSHPGKHFCFIIITSRVPVEGKSSGCLICMKYYRIIILIIIIISLGQILLSYIANTSRTHARTHARAQARTHARMHAHTRTRTHTPTHALTHSRTHARPQAHTHARTHSRTHSRTHARTHTHTHTHTHARTHTLPIRLLWNHLSVSM